LFDMDGTLVDSTAAVHALWRRFAARHGLDLDTLMRLQHGRRTAETVALFAHLGLDQQAETALLAAEELSNVAGVVEIAGAAALLRSLPPHAWAIVTSAERALALARLTAAGLPIPDVLVAAEDVAHGKPDPECYALAVARMGVAAADCVVFEDAPFGIAAAHAAGAAVVALTTSLTETELAAEASLPDYLGVTATVRGGQITVSIKT
jgi:sugar-phosphatase